MRAPCLPARPHRLAVMFAALIVAASACGGGAPATPTSTALEMTTLTVGILPVPDCAPIQIAIEKGFFAEEGLTIKTDMVAGTAAAVPKMVTEEMHVAIANYVTLFQAQVEGVADFTLIADAAQATPNGYVLLVPAASPITSMAELAGKKIGVNTLNNTATLAISAAMREAGGTVDPEQFVEVPLTNLGDALASGQVAAAWGVEPMITQLKAAGIARPLLDLMTGPRTDLAIAGWAVTDDFARENPNTLAAFTRALTRAQEMAAGSREEVEAVLPKYIEIDAKAAAAITLGRVPIKNDRARLEYFAELMGAYNYLSEPLDVSSVLPESLQ